METVQKDSRFAHIAKDPRFHKMKRKERKVKIDKRFKGMFNDRQFKLKYTVDKRGRPVQATTNENLKKFYDISDSDSHEDDNDDDEKSAKSDVIESTSSENKSSDKKLKKLNKNQKLKSLSSTKQSKEQDADDRICEDSLAEDDQKQSSNESSDESDGSEDSIDVTRGPDIARGEGILDSSSDDDSDSEVSDVEEHAWGEMDRTAPVTEDISRRLAICNMDWDRIKAEDLMVLFNSFKPANGVVQSVTIYPSEFGVERMKQEAIKGPAELVTRQDDIAEDNQDDEDYHTETLRRYQFNRLKYYYAVLVCDSVETANNIYEQCDGIDYEGSSTKVDLRFIPDDMTFDQEPKSQVFDVPNVATYKPTFFINSALQQSKVHLTWDLTDPDRFALMKQTFTDEDIEQLDVKDYLASDSDVGEENPYGTMVDTPDFGSVSDEDEDTQIQKYRQLLQGLPDSTAHKHDKDMEMEISWEPGLKETTHNLIEKSKTKDKQSPWDKYLEKRKDKKKEKRAQLKQTKTEQQDSDDVQAFSDDDVPEGLDLKDQFFNEELSDTCMPAKSEKEDKRKKKKKNKHNVKLTEQEQKQQDKEKAELSLLMLDAEEDPKKHFSLKDILHEDTQLKGKNKRRKRKLKQMQEDDDKTKQDDFQMDIQDPRFSALYQNPLYNIDPTVPEYKKTKAMDIITEEKLKHRTKTMEQNSSINKDRKELGESVETIGKDAALASLIKSVKTKTKLVQEKKKKIKRL